MDNRKELSMEELEKAAGGFLVNDSNQNKYWVVRQDGSVIVPAPSEEKAKEYAKSYNVSTTVMSLEEYKNHFGRDLVW